MLAAIDRLKDAFGRRYDDAPLVFGIDVGTDGGIHRRSLQTPGVPSSVLTSKPSLASQYLAAMDGDEPPQRFLAGNFRPGFATVG